MKWAVGALVALVLAGLVAFATMPRLDAACAVQSIHDRLRHVHDGWHCIHYAAARGDIAAIDASRSDGVPIDLTTDDGATPLALAAAHGRHRAVKSLLRHGAAVDGSDDRDTPLFRAAARGHPAVVRALLAAHANVDARNAGGRTPLWINAARSSVHDTEIAHSLANAGATIDAIDDTGDTPLMAAARAGNTTLVGFLIARGADIGHRDNTGNTALFTAITHGHAEVVRQLLARGADPTAPVAGVTPIDAARSRGEDDIVRLLRANNAGPARRHGPQRPSK